MDLNSIHYFCKALTIISGLGLYITNIVFSTKYVIYKLDKNPVINYIDKTLKSKLIYEINQRPHCLNNEEKLVIGTWDGTINKCKCDDGTIKDFDCGPEDINCVTIESEKKNYTVFNGNEICVKNGETYYNLLKSGKIINKYQNCKETDKSCGIIDTFERKLCVKKDEKCPIYKYNIYNNTDNNMEYNLIQFNKNKIYYLNEGNEEEKIISVIQLSDGYPCKNFTEKNWRAYHKEEKIKNQKCSTVKGKSIDDRFVKFDNYNTTKSKLYRDNNLSNYITNELEADNSTINLYGSTFLGLDISLDSFNYQKLISIQNLSNDCNKVMLFISYILLYAVIVPTMKSICLLFMGNLYGYGYRKELPLVFTFVIAEIVTIDGFLVHVILSIIIYICVKRIKWIVADTKRMGEDIIKLTMDELNEKYSINYNFTFSIIIVFVVFFYMGICTIIISSYKRKQKEKEEEKEKENENEEEMLEELEQEEKEQTNII